MEEIWKDIKGYENYYQISNLGRVKSLDRYVTDVKKTQFIKGKILKQFNNGNGYMVVSLLKGGTRKNCYTHRLVAEHFLDNFSFGKVVNHKNFNRQQCDVGNLEMMTQKENVEFSINHKRYEKSYIENGIKHRKNALLKIRKNQKEILNRYDDGESIEFIAKVLHLKRENVRDFVKKRRFIKILCVETGEEFDTISEANRKYNVTTIKDAISGRQKTSAGYHWIKKNYRIR